MARVKYDDLFDPQTDERVKELQKALVAMDKAVQGLAKSFKPAKQAVDEMKKSTEALTTATKKDQEAIKGNTVAVAEMAKKTMEAKTSQAAYAKVLKESNDTIKIAQSNEKRLAAAVAATDTTTKKGIKTLESLNRQRQKNANELKKLTVATNKEKKSADDLNGSYNRLQASIKRNVTKYKAMSSAQRDATGAGQRLTAEIRRQDAQLKKLDSQIGRNFRNVGNYGSALNGAKTSLLGVAAGAGIATSATLVIGQAISNAAKSAIAFEKANAVLAGVLRKSVDEIKDLTKSSLEFGRKTAKTAQEVTELQIALSRLGFEQEEIINLTGGIISGSTALNAGLEETAGLVGSLVRTFDDFSTMDAPMIVDQLTLATQKSALNFERLQTSLPIVAGAANAAGITFTQTTALLAKLADAGIDASMSATSLRNIFIDAASKGLPFNEILQKISGSSDKLTAANDAFGRRTSVSATILARNIKQVGQLDLALQKAAGTAKEAADKQLATLQGRLTLLGSAYDGFVKKILTGNAILGGAFKLLADLGSGLFNSLSQDFAGQITEQKKLDEQLAKTGQAAKDATRGILDRNNLEEIDKALIGLNSATSVIEKEIKRLGDSSLKSAIKFRAIGEQKVNLKIVRTEIELLTKAQAKLADELGVSVKGINELTEAYDDLLKKIVEGGSSFDIQGLFTVQGVKAKEEVEAFKKFIEEGLLGGDVETLGAKVGEALKTGVSEAFNIEPTDFTFFEKFSDFISANEDDIKEAVFALAEGLGEIFAGVFDRRNEQLEQELGAIEINRDAQIAAINATQISEELKAAEIAKINQRAAEEQKRLNTEKAQNDKKAALFEAIIATAVAVAKSVANPFLAAVVGALGAVEIATIASTPLPAFAEGTDFAQGGASIVGEQGTEAVITPSGELSFTPAKASMVDLERGSKVFTAQETKAALNAFNNGARELATPIDFPDIISKTDLEKQTQQLAQAFENQTQHITQIKRGELETYMQRKGNKTKYYNKRYN